MRSVVIVTFVTAALAVPIAQAPAETAAPAGGFDFDSILGGLDLGALLGGLDLGALLGGLLGGGAPDTSTPVIIEGYNSVKSKGASLGAAIAAIPASGDAAAAVQKVVSAIKDIEATMKESVGKMSSIPIVDLISSISLSGPGGEVTSTIESASAALEGKKDAIIKANKKSDILAAAKSLKTATEEYTKAINVKLPVISLQSADAETVRALAAIDRVIAAFT